MSAGAPHLKPIVLVPVCPRLGTDGDTGSTVPNPIPRGLYESSHNTGASTRKAAGVPPLAYFCIRILIDYPDQLHSLGSHRIRCQPQVLHALSPSTFSDIDTPACCLCKLDPRLWSVIVQVYSDLPKGLQDYYIPLGDRHLPLLQAIPSTPSFALITVLNLARCVSDETSHALKSLHGLCALDISQTSISHLGIRHFAPAITNDPSDVHYGTRGLRILRLYNCPKITNKVIGAVSNFQLLAILGPYHLQTCCQTTHAEADLRDTNCNHDLDLGVFQRSTKTQRSLFQCSLQDALQQLRDSDSSDTLFSHQDPFVIHINTKFHPRWPERPDKQPVPATPMHGRLRRHDNPRYTQYSATDIPDPERELREWIRLRLGDASNEDRISEIADIVTKHREYEYDLPPANPYEGGYSIDSSDEEDNIDSSDEEDNIDPSDKEDDIDSSDEEAESRVRFCGYEVAERLVGAVSAMVEEMQKEHKAALLFYGLDPQAPNAVICHCRKLRGASTSLTETMSADRYLMLVRSPPPWDSVYGPGAPSPQKIKLMTKPSLSNSPNINLDRSSLRARESTREMFSMIAQHRSLPPPATPSPLTSASPISTNPFRKVSRGGPARRELKVLHHGHRDPAQGGNSDSTPDSRTPKRIRPISEFPVPPRPTPPTKSQSQKRTKSSGGAGMVSKKPGMLRQTTLLGAFEKRT